MTLNKNPITPIVIDSSGIRTYPYQTRLQVSLTSGTDYL
jgi:hypothetical protein